MSEQIERTHTHRLFVYKMNLPYIVAQYLPSLSLSLYVCVLKMYYQHRVKISPVSVPNP